MERNDHHRLFTKRSYGTYVMGKLVHQSKMHVVVFGLPSCPFVVWNPTRVTMHGHVT
jgi:hypothetical protein